MTEVRRPAETAIKMMKATTMMKTMTMALTLALVLAGLSTRPAGAEELPPEGWWVPATLKLPKAAEGRVAWRFTLREVISIDKDNKLERRPAELKLVRPHTFSTQTPVPMIIELDDEQRILTITLLNIKGRSSAFFTLNPAGEADVQRFDKLVIDVHADSAEVREACDKAKRCCRLTGHEDLIPQEGQRSLTACRDVLTTIRQDLGAQHKAIPTVCR